MFAQTRVTDGLVLLITAEVVVKVAVNCWWDCFFLFFTYGPKVQVFSKGSSLGEGPVIPAHEL